MANMVVKDNEPITLAQMNICMQHWAEQIIAHMDKKMNKRFDEFEEKMDKKMDKRFKKVDTTLQNHSRQLNRINTSMQTIQTNIGIEKQKNYNNGSETNKQLRICKNEIAYIKESIDLGEYRVKSFWKDGWSCSNLINTVVTAVVTAVLISVIYLYINQI